MANFHEEKNYNKQYKVLRFPPIFYINGRIKIIEFSNIQILPGLKAKLLLISIVYSNKIYNRVMRSGNGNKNSPPKVSSHKQKKQLCTCSTPFFLHFFAIVLHYYNVKLPETSQFPPFFQQMLYGVPPVHFSFQCHSFSLSWALAQHFSFSHRCYKIIMLFFQRNWSPLIVISCFFCY